MLAQEQVDHFRTRGYLVLPQFWSADEIAAMRAELDRFAQIGLLRNVATDGDGKTTSSAKQNLQLCPISPHSDLYRAMPFAPQVIETVQSLLGDPLVLHLDQVFVKPGQHGAGTNWHQDNAYFDMGDPLAGTALWTAVHDATLANGTLHLIPDAFHTKLEHTRDPQSDHHIRCFPDESKAVPIELPAGGVVLFAYGTPHCTLGNRTDAARAGVALHFYNADHPAHGGFPPEKRIFLTGKQATGGQAEYGIEVAGTWSQQVNRILGHHPMPVV